MLLLCSGLAKERCLRSRLLPCLLTRLLVLVLSKPAEQGSTLRGLLGLLLWLLAESAPKEACPGRLLWLRLLPRVAVPEEGARLSGLSLGLAA